MCSSNPVSTAVRAATDVATFGTGEIGGVSSKLGDAAGGLLGGNQAPGAPQLPGYPQMTPGEANITGQQTSALGTQQSMIQGVSGQLGQNQSILQQISGLFNSDGSINQNAVAQLQQMTNQSTQTAGQQGQSALQGLSGTQGSLNATSQAYQNALQGNIPQNQQLQYQQNQSFQQMQEQAAQQGINITGTSFANAVSNSTAGQKLIQNFQQNANIQNQNYALGYTQQLAGNMSQLSGAGANQAATGTGLSQYSQQTPLGYLGQSISGGQSALSPLLSAYQQNLSSAYQPQYMQQIGPYQQQTAQAQANYQAQLQQYQAQQSMLGGLGSIAGMGIGAMIGGPAGAMVGGQMGGQVSGGIPSSGVMANPGMGQAMAV